MNLENQIILGDCFEIFKQIPDKPIDLIMTDIPYLYSDKMPSKNSSFCSKVMPTRTDLQKSNIDNGVDISWLDIACRVMKTINIYIWMSKMQIPEYLDYFVKKDCSFEIWFGLNRMRCLYILTNIAQTKNIVCTFVREAIVNLRTNTQRRPIS